MNRQPFLRFFVLLLAIIASLAIAIGFGVPQTVFHADASYMTSAIAFMFIATVFRIGLSSWRGNDWRAVEFGEMMVVLFPMMGLFGTVSGLALHSSAFATQGAQALVLIGTALFSTGAGILSSALTLVLTHNLKISQE